MTPWTIAHQAPVSVGFGEACIYICLYIYIYICCAMLSLSAVFDFLRPHGMQPASLLGPWRFSRQEYWSGLPCPSPGDLPNPGIETRSPALQVGSL